MSTRMAENARKEYSTLVKFDKNCLRSEASSAQSRASESKLRDRRHVCFMSRPRGNGPRRKRQVARRNDLLGIFLTPRGTRSKV